MLTKFFANSVTKPGKSPVLKNPGEFGFDYEDVEFKAADGVVLSGWLVKGGTDKVIKGDPWANFDMIQEYCDSLQVEKEMYWIEGTTKRLESYDWFSHSPEAMLDFFNKYCS